MTDTQTQPALPLFYRDPRPLSSVAHAEWRLIGGDAAFAADTPYVPILIGEFAATSRYYPIVFASPDAAPIAVLGLGEVNLFVTEGAWDADHYVPAYVRRYPFGFIPTGEAGRFALAIDAGSDRVAPGGDAGTALFDADGPSEATRQALAFCDVFHGEAEATNAFAAALREHGLLIERRADATLADGRRFGLHGFQVVDVEKFTALDDAVIVAWHRNGWLGLVHQHLASLDTFPALLARQGRHTAVATEADGDTQQPILEGLES
jgi:hypothetical protein